MMKNRKLNKILNFNHELIDTFINSLDDMNDFFQNDDNKSKYDELYQIINILNTNVDNVFLKYGYVKVEESKENEC